MRPIDKFILHVVHNISNDVMLGNNNNCSFNFIIPCAGITNFGEIIQYNDINFNVKMKVENLLFKFKGKIHVFDLRTYHPITGFTGLEEVGQKSTIWGVKHVPQNRDLFAT